jgi:hypothetical protein
MNIKDGAKEILEQIQSIYTPHHQYERVGLENYRHINRSFYDKTKIYLGSKGFLYLEDCEDLQLARIKNNVLKPTPIRCMVSNNGVIMAGIYHPQIAPLGLRIISFLFRKGLGKIIDFETEFSDGSFVCTSNATSASAMNSSPIIHIEYFPKNVDCAFLLNRHKERIVTYIAEHSVVAVSVKNISELRESQNRMNAIKAAFRGELGGTLLKS